MEGCTLYTSQWYKIQCQVSKRTTKKKSKRYTGPCVVSFALEIVALTSVANDSAWGCNRQASRFDAFTISATA